MVELITNRARVVIARLNAETLNALKSPELVEQFRLQGYEPLGGTPEDLNARIRQDVVQWTRVIREAGIRAQ